MRRRPLRPCTICGQPCRTEILNYDGPGTGWFPAHLTECPTRPTTTTSTRTTT